MCNGIGIGSIHQTNFSKSLFLCLNIKRWCESRAANGLGPYAFMYLNPDPNFEGWTGSGRNPSNGSWSSNSSKMGLVSVPVPTLKKKLHCRLHLLQDQRPPHLRPALPHCQHPHLQALWNPVFQALWVPGPPTLYLKGKKKKGKPNGPPEYPSKWTTHGTPTEFHRSPFLHSYKWTALLNQFFTRWN